MLQELSAPPPITGYAAIGAQLAQAGDNYRQRAQQLQDVASQRAFQEKEDDKRREEQLQTEESLETFRNRNAGIQILINEGYLSGADKDNPQAVADAYKRAQSDGTDKLYLDLLNTPDETGKPLLSQSDKTNPAMVQAAKDKLGALKAHQLQFQMQQPANAQATVDTLSQQLQAHQARIGEISAKLDQPAKHYGLDDPEVQALAVQLAEQAKPGSGRNIEAVNQMKADAQKQLNIYSEQQHLDELQSAHRQIDGERYSMTAIAQALDHAIQVGHAFPSTKPAGVPGGSALLNQSNNTNFRIAPGNAVDTFLKNRPVSSASPVPSPAIGQGALLQNPDNNPVIAAGNEAIQRQAQTNLQSQINSLQQDLQSIDLGLAQSAKASVSPTPISDGPFSANLSASLGYGTGGGQPTMMAPNPIGEANRTSDLLKSKAAKEAQLQTLRAQLQGPTVAAVAPPSINTFSSSTPTPAFATPGGLLSQTNPNWWKSGQAQ